MMRVTIKKDTEAREKLLKGMNKVAYAVGSTLGPKGQNVAINKPGLPPTIIHDGVGVAKSIDLEDPFEDMGAQLIKDAALQTSKKAGDGTTTSTILAQAIANKGFENVTAGMNPMVLKKQIEDASKRVKEEIKKLSKNVTTLEEKQNVATISASDPDIGKLIAEVVHKVGDNGFITVEESRGVDTSVEYKQGLEFNRGSYSPYFVTNGDTGETIIEDPYILITDIKINNAHQIVPFLENLYKANIKNLVVIGEVQEEALSVLVLNKLKAGLNVVAVQAPSYGDMRIQELEDIAVLTGGVMIASDTGRELKSVLKEELGRASKFVCDKETSKIIGGMGSKGVVRQRINQMEKALKHANTPYEKEVRKQRLAKLAGTVAVIHVGAVADSELSDTLERVDDAVSATKAAVEEGIVAGGELTLLYISQQDWWEDNPGSRILREAIKEPFKRLMENSGYEYAEIWGEMSPLKYPYGIDVMDGKKKDLIKSGILDPTKVTRLALEHAVSVATMGMTTKVLISERYKEAE